MKYDLYTGRPQMEQEKMYEVRYGTTSDTRDRFISFRFLSVSDFIQLFLVSFLSVFVIFLRQKCFEIFRRIF